MENYSDDKIRNFCLVGHAGVGKTALADLMLFKSGVTNRLCSSDEGSSYSDFRPEEVERKSSVFSTPLFCEWHGDLFHFIDTPGYADFLGETVAAMSTADATIFVVDAHHGIETGTIRCWDKAKSTARCFVINGMDREFADFDATLQQIQKKYGEGKCVPFTLPHGKGETFDEVYHILFSENCPDDQREQATLYKEMVMDIIAEHDDELMERYLSGEKLSEKEISEGLHTAINDGSLIPVFCTSVAKDIGVDFFMDGMINLMPRPWNGRFPDHEDGSDFDYSSDGPFVGRIFKTVTDPFVGQLNYLRIYSGMLRSDMDIYNVSRDTKEHIGQVFFMNGNHQERIEQAGPGCVVAIPKMKQVSNGDTIACEENASPIVHITYPKPTVSYAVYPEKKGDEEKLSAALHKITDEDPTVQLEQQVETHEMLLHAMGDLQMTLIESRLKQEFKLTVELKTPKIPYRETITAGSASVYRHKKQSGGAGQFGEVHMRIEPMTDGDYAFATEVVGGAIPKNYFPAIEKGVKEAMDCGPLTGSKVINVRSVVTDGKYHPVDSNEISFKIAGRGAFKEAFENARPILLEPVMHMKVMVPDQYTGDVNGDINSRRGRIIGIDLEDGLQVLDVEVPMAESFTFSKSLKSLTQGRGSFEMDFARYERVPNGIAEKIIAQHKAED